jgi:hypothetical protein
MRVLITSAAILSLMAGVATTAGAQTVKAFQLVGFTSGGLPADTGVIGFTEACQAEFETSRMCTDAEVAQTVDIPALPSATAWVMPVFLGDGTLQFACLGWTSITSGENGIGVDNRGRFEIARCDGIKRVACCSLLAVPEPSLSLLQGTAAATLGTLAAKRTSRSTSSTEPPS